MAGSVPNTNKFFRYSHMNRSFGLHKMQIEAVEVRNYNRVLPAMAGELTAVHNGQYLK